MNNKHSHAQNHHFLMVTIAAQGQINPARHLARRLARISKSRVTLATPLSSHRRLFPETLASAGEPDAAATETPFNPDGSGVVSYAPYSDGFDAGAHIDTLDASLFMENLKSIGSLTLSTLLRNLAAAGHPVTCVLHTILLTWAADVARDFALPSFHYWIQPASVFAVYFRYFQGHQGFASASDSNFSIQIPGLPPLRKKDLPSIISTESPYLSAHKEIFTELAKYEKPQVLVNTFYELESEVIDKTPEFELIPIGPVVEKNYLPAASAATSKDLFQEDENGYMKWLHAQAERSVVYVAFGSLTRLTTRQVEELNSGLKESGRPYLWVLRKDSRPEEANMENVLNVEKGIVVEWCSQVRVLDEKAVGCFVTHGGWNSTSEAVVSGVPMVMIPQWIEQGTNARLGEAVWGVGVRAEEGKEGVVEAEELRRCLDFVMGGSERAREIRKRAGEWKEKAREALAEGGSSENNLHGFLNRLPG